jgi:hypothetical protein
LHMFTTSLQHREAMDMAWLPQAQGQCSNPWRTSTIHMQKFSKEEALIASSQNSCGLNRMRSSTQWTAWGRRWLCAVCWVWLGLFLLIISIDLVDLIARLSFWFSWAHLCKCYHFEELTDIMTCGAKSIFLGR